MKNATSASVWKLTMRATATERVSRDALRLVAKVSGQNNGHVPLIAMISETSKDETDEQRTIPAFVSQPSGAYVRELLNAVTQSL